MNIPLYVAVMAALVMMSGYFSATETAFSSFNKTRLKTLAEKGNKRAALALRLEERYDRLLSTILIGNNIVNIALASIGTLFFAGIYNNYDLGATVSTIVITVAVLIFGEITPKNLAKENAESFAMLSAPIIQFLIWVLMPLNLIFSAWKKLISLIFKSKSDSKMSQEELLMLVEEVQQEGSIDNNEGNLLRNAIEFTELKAEDILTHRVDLAAVPLDATKEEIAEKFAKTQFSRLLVFEETIDKIVGVIHQKDFYTASGITALPLDALMAPAIFIHQSEKISQLLKTLQKNKSHIAVVLDEYGGTLGIVTMEDILEELVGEIWDEHDEVVENYKDLGDGVYRVDCSVNLDDFSEFFSVNIESEAVSLGGLVMELSSDLPEVGDTVACEGLEITVVEMDSHRVVFVDVVRLPEETDEETDEESREEEE